MRMDREVKEDCRRFGYDPKTIERGVILCTAVIVDCVQFPSSLAKPDMYGNFTPGRYGWILESVVSISPPIPAKGSLGLWRFDGLDGEMEMRMASL
jgi:hypothetical protein